MVLSIWKCLQNLNECSMGTYRLYRSNRQICKLFDHLDKTTKHLTILLKKDYNNLHNALQKMKALMKHIQLKQLLLILD